jgi:hypothetical protein
MVYLLGSVVMLWTLSSLLGSALRCGGQLPWLAKTEQCFNLVSTPIALVQASTIF